MTFEQMLRRAKGGDQEAITSILLMYRPLLLKYAVINGRLDEVLDEFRTRLRPDSIDVFEDMALIATVGHGMSYRQGVSAKLFEALAAAGVNIRMIEQGSSEMNIIVGVENKDFEKAIRAIYEAFVEEEA